MGFFDSAPVTTSTGTSSASSTGLPVWYNAYLQNIAQAGVDYTNQPYQPYTGARTAGMTDGQTAAQTGTASLLANGNTELPAANTAISNGLAAVNQPAQTWNSTTASNYMSPYTSSVVDEIGRLGNQNFNENIMPGVQSAFIGAGGSGSTRNASVLSLAARDNAANTLGQQATALNSGYTNAQTAFNADANRQLTQQTAAGQAGLSAGSTLGGLGANEENAGLSGLNLQNQIGTQDQTTQQNALNTAYGDFTNQRDWNVNNASSLANLLKGLTLPANPTQAGTTTATQQGATSSPAQGLASLGGVLGSIFATPSTP